MKKLPYMKYHLHLEPGDFVTVIGSNGAGKSTLMNIISGKILQTLVLLRLMVKMSQM